MNLQDGDILICTGDGFIPSIIKKATKSTYSHSAIFVSVKGCPGIIEAQVDGINWKPFDVWKEKYQYSYIVYRRNKLSDFASNRLLRRAFKKAGHTGYDLFSFVIRQPWKLITGNWKYRGEEREVKRMICSEYVGWVYKMEDWWKMTPDDQQKYLEKNNLFSKITG